MPESMFISVVLPEPFSPSSAVFRHCIRQVDVLVGDDRAEGLGQPLQLDRRMSPWHAHHSLKGICPLYLVSRRLGSGFGQISAKKWRFYVFPGKSAEADAAGYNKRQTQRYMERTVRKWKRRQAAAITPEDERMARAYVVKWQGKLWELTGGTNPTEEIRPRGWKGETERCSKETKGIYFFGEW